MYYHKNRDFFQPESSSCMCTYCKVNTREVGTRIKAALWLKRGPYSYDNTFFNLTGHQLRANQKMVIVLSKSPLRLRNTGPAL